jgi:hypothetical protein
MSTIHKAIYIFQEGKTMKSIGRARDMKLLEMLEKHLYMSTDQAARLPMFATIKNKEQRECKAAGRLRALYKNDFIPHRFKSPGDHIIYSMRKGEYNHKVRHYLAIVDVWIALTKYAVGAKLYSEVEKKTEDVITDLYVEYRNEFRGEKRNYYFEIELNNSQPWEEKLSKYEALFWAQTGDNAPGNVLVLVSNKKRLREDYRASDVVVRQYDLALTGWKW